MKRPKPPHPSIFDVRREPAPEPPRESKSLPPRPAPPPPVAAASVVDWTPCPWTIDGTRCNRPVRGIDPCRTCEDCQRTEAPVRVDYSVVVGRHVR